jgi:hypothetical protein
MKPLAKVVTERKANDLLYQPSDWVTLGGFPNRR